MDNQLFFNIAFVMLTISIASSILMRIFGLVETQHVYKNGVVGVFYEAFQIVLRTGAAVILFVLLLSAFDFMSNKFDLLVGL